MRILLVEWDDRAAVRRPGLMSCTGDKHWDVDRCDRETLQLH